MRPKIGIVDKAGDAVTSQCLSLESALVRSFERSPPGQFRLYPKIWFIEVLGVVSHQVQLPKGLFGVSPYEDFTFCSEGGAATCFRKAVRDNAHELVDALAEVRFSQAIPESFEGSLRTATSRSRQQLTEFSRQVGGPVQIILS